MYFSCQELFICIKMFCLQNKCKSDIGYEYWKIYVFFHGGNLIQDIKTNIKKQILCKDHFYGNEILPLCMNFQHYKLVPIFQLRKRSSLD